MLLCTLIFSIKAFLLFDKNKDGKISAEELGTMMRSLGKNPSDEALRRMIYEADSDENGFIDFSEFLTLMARRMKRHEQNAEIIQAFSAFDKDGDGKISPSELKTVLTGLGEPVPDGEVEEIIRQVDKDGDGVSFSLWYYCTYSRCVLRLLRSTT